MTAKHELHRAYQDVRNKTVELCRPLMIEDYVVQSIDDVSPPKWHLAHTTWFFETFLLIPYLHGYKSYHPIFHHLFNSYYQTIGNPYPRVRRGLLSRPTVETIYNYRNYVDQHMEELIHESDELTLEKIFASLTLGLHHEQQHQELLLMDVKHNFSLDPNFPVFWPRGLKDNLSIMSLPTFKDMEGGVIEIGYGGNKFCFDNELPRYQLILKPYSLATKLVSNAEYLEFIHEGGYQTPNWWLADGWECVQKHKWNAPLYWHQFDDKWYVFTLSGLREIDPNEPVAHISYYEADAYARFRNLRLPSEGEWEHYTNHHSITPHEGNFLENCLYHPQPSIEKNTSHSQQLFGDVWEWTSSPYCPYPGYKPQAGALGEYNGKFMSNQFVLRGGSCVTPASHIRASYRNFFQPDKRWQFSGIRLAADI